MRPPVLEQPCCNFSMSELSSATDNFDEKWCIGHGGFGKVYKGKITDGPTNIYAIKRLHFMSEQGASELWIEVEMLSRVRHCNLVSLIGYCNEGKDMALVYEYMPNGTLCDHLATHLTCTQRLKICIGAARGLDYLHTGTGTQQGVIIGHCHFKKERLLQSKEVLRSRMYGHCFQLKAILNIEARGRLELKIQMLVKLGRHLLLRLASFELPRIKEPICNSTGDIDWYSESNSLNRSEGSGVELGNKYMWDHLPSVQEDHNGCSPRNPTSGTVTNAIDQVEEAYDPGAYITMLDLRDGFNETETSGRKSDNYKDKPWLENNHKDVTRLLENRDKLWEIYNACGNTRNPASNSGMSKRYGSPASDTRHHHYTTTATGGAQYSPTTTRRYD